MVANFRNSTDRQRFLRRVALPSVCLCLVAGLHVVRVVTAGQTPWKGGGFGMFSTVDAETSRLLRVWLETSSGDIAAQIPVEWEKHVAELRAAPSRSAARELAARLAQRNWAREGARRQQLAAGQGATFPASSLDSLLGAAEAMTDSEEALGLSVERVRVEVWKYVFEPATGRLVARPVLVAHSRERDQP